MIFNAIRFFPAGFIMDCGIKLLYLQDFVVLHLKVYVTNRHDRYELICDNNAHDKEYDNFSGLISSAVDRTFPKKSSSKALKLLGNTINLIESWLKF